MCHIRQTHPHQHSAIEAFFVASFGFVVFRGRAVRKFRNGAIIFPNLDLMTLDQVTVISNDGNEGKLDIVHYSFTFECATFTG